MDVVIKISAVALIATACALLLKKINPEISYAISVLTAAVICLSAIGLISAVRDAVLEVVEKTGQSPAVFLPIIKCVAIAVTVKLVSGLCKDAGQSAVASAIEYSGCAAALIVSLPLIRTMLQILEGLT